MWLSGIIKNIVKKSNLSIYTQGLGENLVLSFLEMPLINAVFGRLARSGNDRKRLQRRNEINCFPPLNPELNAEALGF